MKTIVKNQKIFKITLLGLLLAVWLVLPISQIWAQTADPVAKKSAYQRRREAEKRLQAVLEANGPQKIQQVLDAQASQPETPAVIVKPQAAAPVNGKKALGFVTYPTGINPAVDMSLPNFAQSPNIRKFVNTLPGLGWANRNNMQQYIPVGKPNTSLYPGSDYYEIGLKDYNQPMNSDLPPTKLRGYYQINTTDPCVASMHYLGPLIIAQRDRAVRFKFVNQLNLSNNTLSNLFLPVDTGLMGAGMGPIAGQSYTQNRATIHLHGGLTPWISDGTPHQWITPAGDPTVYKKGVSFQNVPDMVGAGKSVPNNTNAGDGIGTYYYPNTQSARLMFYHDHAYGITRLNVYAGEAAGYLLVDQVEKDLIAGTNVSTVFGVNTPVKVLPDQNGLDNGTGLYHYGIPLVIQDKTFINDGNTPVHATFAGTGATATAKTITTDPLWYNYVAGTKGGNMWMPHEYLPNENIYNATGFNDMGRWDYAPWMIPAMPALNNVLPSPTIIPETYGDTAIVNGCAFPYVTLPPKAVRFRILNACNDRMLNLQLYYADPCHPTEVKMVPASPNASFPTWPKDGRDGGVPDPTTAGPDIIQIGNECGFLAQVAELPQQPVDYDYNRRSVTYGGLTSKTLLIPPAVRADIIVDFSKCAPGSTLILYNDAPAPMPLYDSRNDYYTGDPDQTANGGAPSTPIGFGPNTRTIMQIKIAGTPVPYDVNALKKWLPKAFAKAQDPPLVPAAAYNAAYGTSYSDVYANSIDETLNLSGTTKSVASIMTTLPGLGYTTAPTVSLYGGGVGGGTPGVGGTAGVRAVATASLNGITGLTLVTAGSGYATAPTVTIGAPGAGGIQATAAAIVSGGVVTTLTVTNPGSNYTVAPAVSFSGGTALAGQAIVLPTATSTITLGSVGAITITNAGSGYVKAPYVYLTGGGGTGATASAMLAGDLVLNGKNLVEGFDMEYGRMNAVLGSTPNPLAPTVGAGPILAANFYVDPPTEILKDGETVIWRMMHLGVDSHAIHFHLFNVQVVNRVDWTNTIKPPYPDEIGWKETIRTNPFEDIILAIKPVSMPIPFAIPNSNRLLDPTNVAGSTANFLPVAPPPGVPAVAQLSNVMTDFGWEYVWHCHLLGHEENDMMRPLVFHALPVAPTGISATSGNASATVYFTAPVSTGSGPITSYTATASPGGRTGTGTGTATSVTITGLTNGTPYTLTVTASNAYGAGPASSPSNSVIPAVPPSAPSRLTATASAANVTPPRVVLAWRDNSNNETGFTIQRATNTTFTTGLKSYTVGANVITYTDTNSVAGGTTYYYRVASANGTSLSAWSNVVTATTFLSTAPTGLAVAAGTTRTRIPLTWAFAGTATGYSIQSATNAGFTTGLKTTTIRTATLSGSVSGLRRGRTYWFRVAATNAAGAGPYSTSISAATLP